MKKILILAGGYSNEREISIQTAKSVYKELAVLSLKYPASYHVSIPMIQMFSSLESNTFPYPVCLGI